MLKKIRVLLRSFGGEKFARKRSSRFSKRRFRVPTVSSRKCKNRRIHSYQMAVNVNESAVDENAKGCRVNPVCSTCSLRGHCSTSMAYYARIASEKLNEREIDKSGETRSSKKVVDCAECQSASISCSTSDRPIPVSSKSNTVHLHISKNSCRMKVENLRFDYKMFMFLVSDAYVYVGVPHQSDKIGDVFTTFSHFA